MQIIPIQSFSDVITNSSSEVFCTINANKDVINQIRDILETVIKDDYDWDESTPHLRYRTKEEVIEDGWHSKEELSKLPEAWIEIEMPYSMSEATEFYKAGIKALLDCNNIKDYTIKYE